MAPSSTSTFVILVVEDDLLVRMSAVDLLEDAGFQVLEAANADDAIRLLETHCDINVVFTDIDMPGSMDGLKLAYAVRDRWPPIKIIATSGHFKIGEEDLPPGGRFLAKPYNVAQIKRTLHKRVGRLSNA